MASYNGAVYASGFGLSATGGELRDVWVSGDSGRLWRALGATHLNSNPYIWLNPQTGELLGTDNTDLIPTLWRSEDGGASWARIAVPNVVGAGASQQFLVAPNGAGWRVCVTGLTAPSVAETTAVGCSNDLGKTWTQPPSLNTFQASPRSLPGVVFAITTGGALLATYDGSSITRLATLTLGARGWAPLGLVGRPPDGVSGTSASSLVYTTGPGGGMLWVLSGDPANPFVTAMLP